MTFTRQTLVRWSGATYAVSGLLTAAYWFIHPGLEPQNALLGRWAACNGLFLAILVLGAWGLTGAYARQAEKAGLWGFLGYLAGFAGTVLFIGAGVFDAFVTPFLTREAPQFLGMQGPLFSGPLGKFFMLTGLCFALGNVLFGIATARAGVLPRWAGAALALSSPILGLSPLMPSTVRTAGCIVYGISCIGLGWSSWRAEGT